MEYETKVVIIGAGIAGITAAIYLQRTNTEFVLIDKDSPGGKLNLLADIENYPGFSHISGPDLAFNFFEQLLNNGIKVKKEDVMSINENKGQFIVTTSKNKYTAKSVLVATGTIAKELKLPKEDEFKGNGLSTCAICDGSLYKGKDVAVIGNKDIAIEEALYLSKFVNHVYFVTSDSELRGSSILIDTLKRKKNVTIKLNETVSELGGDKKIESIKTNKNIYSVEAVFPYIGQRSSTSFLSSLNVDNVKGYIVTNEDMQTNVPGIFAAGDIRKKHLRQLVTAASDGATAAISIIRYLK